jgi:hypothetical protein
VNAIAHRKAVSKATAVAAPGPECFQELMGQDESEHRSAERPSDLLHERPFLSYGSMMVLGR